jgi:hypothetical protein
MFGCYRKGDANDPDTYVAAIAAVLADYPADVIQSVTDPRTGLPSKSDWPPTVREVKSACEDIEGPRRRAREWERGAQEQLKSRALPPPTRPTLEELKEKYGPNWGIGQATKGDDERKQARSDMMRAANKTVFERECKRHWRRCCTPMRRPSNPACARPRRSGASRQARIGAERMILAFVGGAAVACGLMWFGWWLLFAPIDPVREPRELGAYEPYGER